MFSTITSVFTKRVEVWVGARTVGIRAGAKPPQIREFAPLHTGLGMADAADAADVALQNLHTLLIDAKLSARGVHATLSHVYGCFTTLPHLLGLSGAERLAFARARLADIQNESEADWSVSYTREIGRHALVYGLPTRLVDALRAAIATTGARLVSIQPALAHALDAGSESRDSGWLVVDDGERMVVAHRDESGWIQVRSRVTSHRQDGRPGELVELLDQMSQLDETDTVDRSLSVSGLSDAWSEALQQVGWTVRRPVVRHSFAHTPRVSH